MTATGKDFADREPGDIEALLPWHAAGTLSVKDTRRVEEALAKDPALAKQYEVIQDELAETILLNESLGAPSTRAMEKLFAAIDAEPARSSSSSVGLIGRIGDFFSSLSPRTLAWAAIAGALALVLQAGVISSVLVKGGGGFQTASYEASSAGTKALVGFKPDATLAEITAFLSSYRGMIVAGPQAGMFTVKFGDKNLSQQNADVLLGKLKNEKIVTFVAATQ
jgi:anti-sigma-K factor RskA